ncbi:MAG TPA: DNA polymerase III subunit delta [Candidatus Krumholzibacteria bacterium]|nr:DNA polymerase III subunit delta [Candidatus Krumholzibacteria bacterium]
MGRQADGYRKLFDDVRAGRVRPLYFLYGPEEFMKREFLRELAAAVLPEGDRTFNLDILHGEEFDPQAFDDRVQAFPLFAKRRLLVLKNFDALSTSLRESVTARAAALPDGLVLVIESAHEKLETVAHKRLAEVASKTGVAHAFGALDESETMERVLARFRREEYRIDPDALDLLIESVGTALIDLSNEVDKILLAAGETRHVTRELVASVVGKYRTVSLFSLLDAAGSSAPATVLPRLSTLLESGEEPVFIVAMLLRRVVSLMEVQRVMAERGRAVSSDRALADAIAATPSPYFAGRLREQAGRISGEKLESLLANLRWADLRLKTTSLDARCVIEEALLAAHAGKTLASPAAAA